MNVRTKWLALAVGGLLLIGCGLSLFGEAIIRKAATDSVVADWFWLGTLSLCLINAGICCVVGAGQQK